MKGCRRTEDLWSTIWGKVVTKIRDEILYNGEETEEEKIEIGPDKDVVQEIDPTVKDLPGRHQELSPIVTDLAVDLPVHAAVMPKKHLVN